MSGFVDDILSSGRALAQRLMESTVRVRRATGETRDQEAGRVVTTWTTIYEGPARIRFTGSQPRDLDVAGQRLVEQTPTVSLPIDVDARIVSGSSSAVRVDDVGEVLTNMPDPAAIATTFRVAGEHDQTHSTARRFPVEVISHG